MKNRKCPNISNALPTRNGEAATDWSPHWLRAPGLFTRRYLGCPPICAGYGAGSRRCTEPPIAFISKLKTRMRGFGFFDPKTG